MRSWFENKRVAVVGNASSLFGKNYGQLIDSHDVICRINKGIVDIPEESHGSCIDVLAFSHYATVRKACAALDYPPQKFIHCSNKHRGRSSQMLEESKLTFYPEDRWNLLKEKLGINKRQSPTTGISLLDYISTCDPGLVSIFGFDWKKTPTFYMPNVKHEPHNYKAEKRYCLNTFVKKLGYKYYQ